jgi:hypothetical protein
VSVFESNLVTLRFREVWFIKGAVYVIAVRQHNSIQLI